MSVWEFDLADGSTVAQEVARFDALPGHVGGVSVLYRREVGPGLTGWLCGGHSAPVAVPAAPVHVAPVGPAVAVKVEGSMFYGDHGPASGSTCEHSRVVDGRMVLVRYCGYCWAEYLEPKAHKAYFCSKECRDRNGAWNRWVADSNAAAVSGDVNRPAKVGAKLPAAGATLAAAVGRFQLSFELAEVAA